jgi:hypothetical protein
MMAAPVTEHTLLFARIATVECVDSNRTCLTSGTRWQFPVREVKLASVASVTYLIALSATLCPLKQFPRPFVHTANISINSN